MILFTIGLVLLSISLLIALYALYILLIESIFRYKYDCFYDETNDEKYSTYVHDTLYKRLTIFSNYFTNHTCFFNIFIFGMIVGTITLCAGNYFINRSNIIDKFNSVVVQTDTFYTLSLPNGKLYFINPVFSEDNKEIVTETKRIFLTGILTKETKEDFVHSIYGNGNRQILIDFIEEREHKNE